MDNIIGSGLYLSDDAEAALRGARSWTLHLMTRVAALGGTVRARVNRHGSVLISVDGAREQTVHAATCRMQKMLGVA